MKRRTLLTATVAGLTAVACGDDSSGNGAGESARGSETAGREVKHLLGVTEVPAGPERVATLWASTMSAMITLGESPAAYAFNAEPIEGVDVPVGFDVSRLDHLGHSTELNLERIAAAAPDLILATDAHEESYDRLSEIAPTVVLQWGGTSAWKKHLTDVADVLDRQEAAERAIAEYEARASEVADAIGDPGAIEASIVRFHAEELRLEVRNSFPGQVLADVGLSRPEVQNVEEEGSGYIPVSMERLPDADGDVMFVFTIADAEAEAPNLLERARNIPLWDNLGAVQNDAVFPVDYKTWIASNYISAHAILDDLEKALA